MERTEHRDKALMAKIENAINTARQQNKRPKIADVTDLVGPIVETYGMEYLNKQLYFCFTGKNKGLRVSYQGDSYVIVVSSS